MTDKTNYLEDSLLDHIFNATALPTIDDPEIVLLSAVGNPETAVGTTELPEAANGYVAIPTATVNTTMGAASAGTITNPSGAFTFGPATPGGWVPVEGVAVRATGSGNYLYIKALSSSVTVNLNESLSFDATNFTVIED